MRSKLSWWCRHGGHSWSVVAVSAVRVVDGLRMGSVTERCRDCPAARHEQNVVLAGSAS